MTPQQFASAMRTLHKADYDEERAHVEADDLLCATLEALGYTEGIAVYRDIPKWYA